MAMAVDSRSDRSQSPVQELKKTACRTEGQAGGN